MGTAQPEKNGTFTGRARKAPGLDESKSGFATKKEAREWADGREDDYVKARGERGLGPNRTAVADALLKSGLQTLPFKKGAAQEANRINVVLRLAGRSTLRVTPYAAPVGRNEAETFEKRKAQIKFFDVVEVAPGAARRVVPSLAAHRAEQEYMSDECRKVLTRLANKWVGDLTSADLNDLVMARANDGKSASTLRQDVNIFRSMLNRVRRAWNWPSVPRIRNDEIEFPKLPEGRKVTCSPHQETKLAAAMAASYQPKAVAATAMLIETTMRFSECMGTARWCDFDREARLIRLSQAKAGARDVPLNENAMAVLGAMQRGEPEEPIFGFSYESYKKIFERACEKAGIEGLKVHDLRHTGATRAAKRFNGNIFLLQALTGHKTLAQLQRYVHVGASDVVEAFAQTAGSAGALQVAAPSVPALTAAAVGHSQMDENKLRSAAQYRAAARRLERGEKAWPGLGHAANKIDVRRAAAVLGADAGLTEVMPARDQSDLPAPSQVTGPGAQVINLAERRSKRDLPQSVMRKPSEKAPPGGPPSGLGFARPAQSEHGGEALGACGGADA